MDERIPPLISEEASELWGKNKNAAVIITDIISLLCVNFSVFCMGFNKFSAWRNFVSH